MYVSQETVHRRNAVLDMKTISQRVDDQTSHVLYNGEVRYDFDPVRHIHYINGNKALSVTTTLGIINKPFLIPWAANQAADEVKRRLVPGKALDEIGIQKLVADAKTAHKTSRDSAADMGTYIHNWIEEYTRGKDPDLPVNTKLHRTILDFKKFWDSQDIVPIHAERPVCSPTYNLAGIPDLICKVDGKLTIMDWKTGSGIYPEMFLQLAAYALMYEEEFPSQKVEQLFIVNASVKYNFKTECRTEIDIFKKTYLQALELYKSNQEVTKLVKGGAK